MNVPDFRTLDEQAVLATVALVDRIGPADLARATPCAEWNLGALLAHLTVQHQGFAAAAEGNGAEPAAWRLRPLGADPTRDYAEAAEQVVVAFAGQDVPTRTFALPEFGPGFTAPGWQAISFHFIDYVVHGWDVARALDVPFELPWELLLAAVPVAEAVPDGERRLVPGAAFAPCLPDPEGSDPLTRILSALGRSPDWQPA